MVPLGERTQTVSATTTLCLKPLKLGRNYDVNTDGIQIYTDAVTSEREETAYHEAGHVVAVRMRGATLRSAAINECRPGWGFTGYRISPLMIADDAFISWAGPWAQPVAADGLNICRQMLRMKRN